MPCHVDREEQRAGPLLASTHSCPLIWLLAQHEHGTSHSMAGAASASQAGGPLSAGQSVLSAQSSAGDVHSSRHFPAVNEKACAPA